MPSSSDYPWGQGNQYFPNLPQAPTVSPGVVPPSYQASFDPKGGSNPSNPYPTDYWSHTGWTERPISPQLTQDWTNWLGSQMGQGATPYGGQINAGIDPLIAQLQKYYQTGQTGGMPGLDTINQMSETGMPIDQTAQWQAMVDAMQRQIGQGAEGIREQMAFSGNLASSPFGQALTDYYGQSSKDLNAQLLQAQAAALESARQRQYGASEFLTGGAASLGQYLQGLSQDDLNRLLAEFIRTRPEYSPLLNAMFGQANSYSPVINDKYGIGATGAVLQGAGTIADAIASIYDVYKGSSSGSQNIYNPTGTITTGTRGGGDSSLGG